MEKLLDLKSDPNTLKDNSFHEEAGARAIEQSIAGLYENQGNDPKDILGQQLKDLETRPDALTERHIPEPETIVQYSLQGAPPVDENDEVVSKRELLGNEAINGSEVGPWNKY